MTFFGGSELNNITLFALKVCLCCLPYAGPGGGRSASVARPLSVSIWGDLGRVDGWLDWLASYEGGERNLLCNFCASGAGKLAPSFISFILILTLPETEFLLCRRRILLLSLPKRIS